MTAGQATKRALVTGAAGFAGRALCAYLAERGWDIVACDLRAPSGPGQGVVCDVTDRDAVSALVAAQREVSHVFHLAALTFVPDATRDPSRTFAVNLQGTVHLTQALREHAPRARLIYIGSAGAYGQPQSLPITETHPIQPKNPYAISKAAADQYCGFLHEAGALDVLRVRPFNHAGAGQPDVFVLSSFARQVAGIESGRLPAVLRVGNLDSRRDFSHVSDVVRAYEAIALEGEGGEVYNVCSGEATCIQDALDQLLEMSRVAIRVEPDPSRLRAVDVSEVRGSYDKLRKRTGWEPEMPFDSILADLLDHWRQEEGAPAR